MILETIDAVGTYLKMWLSLNTASTNRQNLSYETIVFHHHVVVRVSIFIPVEHKILAQQADIRCALSSTANRTQNLVDKIQQQSSH